MKEGPKTSNNQNSIDTNNINNYLNNQNEIQK
jgi:hypothetical protein